MEIADYVLSCRAYSRLLTRIGIGLIVYQSSLQYLANESSLRLLQTSDLYSLSYMLGMILHCESKKKLGHFFTAYNFRNIENIFTKLGRNHVLFILNITP